jgi:acetylornithine deacetylase/succinyl-diaminopimelate desuccinylase-like protein
MDCKGLVAAEAWAMLKLSHVPLAGRLIFAATADEEAGGLFGVRFLLENFPQKLASDFAINEGGEEPWKINNKLVYFIQVGEKGVAWTRLKAKGVSCHGSVPDLGDNAVVKMAEAIRRLSQYKPKAKLIPEVKILLDFLAQQRGWGEAREEDIDRFLESFGERGLTAYLRAITRMTVSANVIHGGTRTNVVPDRCETQVDIRLLPGQDKEYILAELSPILGSDIEIDIAYTHPASFSSPRSFYYELIEKNIKDIIGDVACLPYVSSGATDSRFLRERGINSYGLAIMSPDYDPQLRSTYHAKNERIDVNSLKLRAEFLQKLALTYLGGK